MRNLKKKISALVLSTVFASMQLGSVAAGLSDASINKIDGGFVNAIEGNNSLDLNFNGSAHVNWNQLNVNKGESLEIKNPYHKEEEFLKTLKEFRASL